MTVENDMKNVNNLNRPGSDHDDEKSWVMNQTDKEHVEQEEALFYK